MSENDDPIRVVAIANPGPTQQQIQAALGSLPDFLLVSMLTFTDKLFRELRSAEPDILLIDHLVGDTSSLSLVDDLVLQFPDTAVVLILPDNDPIKAQQAMLAGARGFIVQPFTQITLVDTLRRIYSLEERRASEKTSRRAVTEEAEQPLRIIAVFSPRGGAGCTTVATNLAIAMHQQLKQRVLLIEGKMFFGHLGVFLNIYHQNTIADLIPHANNLDEGLINDVIYEHSSGVHVLLAPSNIQVAQGIRTDDLYAVFDKVQRMFDLVVIDAGGSLTENTVTFLDASDRIILLANPDMASLSDTSHFLQLTRSLAYSSEKVLIVLNRLGMAGGIKLRDIQNVLHNGLFAEIPDGGSAVNYSINRGIPLIVRYPRNQTTKAIQKLADEIINLGPIGQNLTPGETSDQGQRDVLIASSQLG